MVKILVTGKNGQLGHEFSRLSKSLPVDSAHRFSWTFLDREILNLEAISEIKKKLNLYKPDIIINCAAYTKVDLAETNLELCYRVNCDAVTEIASWCASQGACLIHFSTDYVYPGTGELPWLETSGTGPLNTYGKSKLAGEISIQKQKCRYYIFRTSWVYSSHGSNFMKTMLRLGRERETIKVVDDQVGAPTAASDLAALVFQVISHERFNDLSGVYNLAGQGFVSWFGFAREIFRVSKSLGNVTSGELKVKEVLPIPSSEFATPAQRPKNSRLSQEKIKDHFQLVMPPWQSSLDEILKEL